MSFEIIKEIPKQFHKHSIAYGRFYEAITGSNFAKGDIVCLLGTSAGQKLILNFTGDCIYELSNLHEDNKFIVAENISHAIIRFF